MVERVASILRHELREIIGSPLILELLDIYSKLYLHGGQPGTCERCHKEYFFKLQKNGKKMAERYDELKKNTNVPSWNGVKYVPKLARHFDSENITDAEAIKYLKEGQLTEDDFEKLPDGYLEKESVKVQEPTEVEEKKEFKPKGNPYRKKSVK